MSLPGLPGPYVGSLYTKGNVQAFIPEIWMDFVRTVRDAKLVAARSSYMFPIAGKKGDRFHVPVIDTPSVQDKLPETPITVTTAAPTDYTVDVTYDKISAFGVENILDVQSKFDLMNIYTQRHGFAMSRWIDNDVLGMRAAIYNIAAQNVFASSNGLITGNGTRFDFASFLAAKTVLDAADVPEDRRILILGVQQYNACINQNFFSSRDYTGDRLPVLSGNIGNILGTPVVATSQIKINSITGFTNGLGATAEPGSGVAGSRFLPAQDSYTGLPLSFTGNSKTVMSAIMCNIEWMVSLMQWMPKASHSFENLLQTDVVVFRQVYGLKIYRSDHAVNIHSTNELS